MSVESGVERRRPRPRFKLVAAAATRNLAVWTPFLPPSALSLATLLIDLPLMLITSHRMRHRRDDPSVSLPQVSLAVMAGRSVPTAMHYWYNKRFYDFVRSVPELKALMYRERQQPGDETYGP